MKIFYLFYYCKLNFCIFFLIKMIIEVALGQKKVGIFENVVNKDIKRKKLKEEMPLTF